MKRLVMCGCVIVLGMWLCGTCKTCRAGDPNGLLFSGGAMAGDSAFELRAGIQYRWLEAYVAPVLDKSLAEDGDVCTNIRGYAIWNAVDANMVAKLFGSDMTLPPGNLYAGLYYGYAFAASDSEIGWALGGRVTTFEDANWKAETCVEYQQSISSLQSDTDEYKIATGVRFLFK